MWGWDARCPSGEGVATRAIWSMVASRAPRCRIRLPDMGDLRWFGDGSRAGDVVGVGVGPGGPVRRVVSLRVDQAEGPEGSNVLATGLVVAVVAERVVGTVADGSVDRVGDGVGLAVRLP